MAGMLAENLVRFGHYLRRLGLKAGTAEILEAFSALKEVNLLAREEVEAALRAVLAKSPREQEIFKAAFARFFAPSEEKRQLEEDFARQREREERALLYAREELARLLAPWQLDRAPDAEAVRTFARIPPEEKARLAKIIGQIKGNPVNDPGRLVLQVMHSALNYWRYHLLKTRGAKGRAELEEELTGEGGWPGGVPAEFYRDPRERLLHQDLQDVADEDLEAISRLIHLLAQRLARRLSNRYKRSRRQKLLDMRRTIRQNLGHGGALLELRYRSRRRRLPRLLLICDVSASMARYARFVLQFMYGFGRAVKNLEVFIFSEDLERVTPFFHGNDFAPVMAELINKSSQWGKTTNFYTALLTLRHQYAHLIGPSATVLVVSDTKTVAVREAGEELAGLRRQVREILWLNPVPKEMWGHLPGVAVFASQAKMQECRSLHHLQKIIRQWEG